MDLTRLFEQLEATSVWQVAPVTDEPHTRLAQWQIYSVEPVNAGEPNTIHFVGYAGYEGRVCSAVQTFDITTRRGITQSGRIYELVGEPGYNSDAMYVWDRWIQINGNPKVENVTESYLNK